MFRVHQFDKVEMFVYCRPEDSVAEHERLLAIEEELVAELELPYRVVNIAAGDLGASAAKKYDIEAWFPGQERYREITSTSNTTDFQARRLGRPLPPRGQASSRPHAERDRGDGAGAARDPRELPARGRHGRRAGAAARLRRPGQARRRERARLSRPEETDRALFELRVENGTAAPGQLHAAPFRVRTRQSATASSQIVSHAMLCQTSSVSVYQPGSAAIQVSSLSVCVAFAISTP